MRRVVITGIGIVSPIGNNAAEVEASLRAGRSGISFSEDYAHHGFRSQIHGMPDLVLEDHVDKRDLRFMGAGAAYNFIAMEQAIKDSGLEATEVSNPRTGLVMGSGGPSTSNFFQAHKIVIEKGSPKRMGPFMVTRCMSSTNSACLATPFKIKGVNYSITSACSTSAHCIGNGTELIQMGKQDIVFAGGGEELDWTLSCLFDAMGAMSSKYNDAPETASRPFDATRDGFVIAGGGGVVVLEELEHALARGAKIYAEVTGYGATSDGADMVAPSGEGGERSMRLALGTLPEGRRVDYINAHGTSTPAGDVTEVRAIRRIFGEGKVPPISSTKSLTGHSLGATGVHEAIYSILMMQGDFIAASANVTQLDPEIQPDEIATTLREGVEIDSVLSNSFGFGGTNASLLLSKFNN
ncbi:beta-ketoacyl-ACP synthase I [Rhodobacter sphaeroides]|jgi:3-oxoacyl-[acyl-carrier-protein] synthase-1|uniref:3-oxoacyl-[acyl-carrier-protein] synthase 1 n=1 Tax=Cereibacter sphaeroides (strain ATCC 17023 / DSM 158 / JCM 6121 / CCUG 31486 / LMG 2827 / NBRC 12203 / NCIMB 8253 / ATH 2.4.1.) TaxID=272943 RepID=Q3IXE2_CERS4|nr:beta-ketoacyl-ACP synthase I [Cereibacter sphaeroides]ABA80792.1 3-oxoacyl-(acyl-carrier-protein) synthase I [Cereibacter sphaeroides 2.4.1]AMJ49118.1 3-oxoacyl-ACP synthase [Cereibacter sphaeroides]ANS35834.1 beta-ketoacyl-[acyl-carrier-protein] synthase I [Cereibacter sphaeroides]ATN64887.1 beta-ketoacyl-[acyl-carrier-protein] synthase I [Cereibacter sphaeroides]AXC63081.1 beta-ketoacyl-ACP synthase I [Cereibacter sphaeroides 2.4.1]